jgi:predicted metal-binding protein
MMFLPGSAPSLRAADVTGELVDLACYKKDGAKNRGAAHQECAMTCARKGMTVALVTEQGDVYLVGGALAQNNNARLVNHMSHKVSLQGSLAIDNETKTILASALKMISK